MKATVIPIVISALGTVPKVFEKILNELEVMRPYRPQHC